MSLTKSIRKTNTYAIGGIIAVLAFATKLANGVNALTITRESPLAAFSAALTSGAATTGSLTLAVVALNGATKGDSLSGTGLAVGTVIVDIAGLVLTLSAPASVTAATVLTASHLATSSASSKIIGLALAVGQPVVRLEFEENEALFSDNTTFGANKFPKHQLGMKFNGRDALRNDVIQALDLERNTFLAKLASGQVVLLGGVNGLTGEKSDSGAGAKAEDFFGYDVLLSGAELEKAPVVPTADFNRLADLVLA